MDYRVWKRLPMPHRIANYGYMLGYLAAKKLGLCAKNPAASGSNESLWWLVGWTDHMSGCDPSPPYQHVI